MGEGAMLRVINLALVCLLAVSCAPVKPLATPSGRPEVTITGATKKQILDVLVENLVGQGMELRRLDDYTAVFGKRDSSFGSAVLFGSRYDSTPEMRVTFTLVDVAGAVRVYCNAAMVTNPGSAHERISDATAANGEEIQQMLQRLRARFK